MDVDTTERVVQPGQACAIEMEAGQSIDIVDVQGKQVADLVAFSLADMESERLSPTHTRSSLGRLKLKAADTLLTNFRRPILELVHDDVGVHDMAFAMCDPERYLLDYGLADHPSCREAMSRVLAPYKVVTHRIPDPVNVFQNSTIDIDGIIETKEPMSRAGDRASFVALMDALVVVSACPQDQNPCNGWAPTPIALHGPADA